MEEDRDVLDVLVVGAGIAGLTAAALLAKAGLKVALLEAHSQSGGCAGTFRRGAYVFDVGATQVAGLEPGGIHSRLFRHLGVEPPAATPLDPACVVDLDDGRPPVRIWRDPTCWRRERLEQFPGSERFWALCDAVHRANWSFAGRDPVLPPRSWWDLRQLLGALSPANLATAPLIGMTMADLLTLTGCGTDRRLRRFLDLQLKLYSQEPADRTAALYGATVLAMGQEPQGLWHLKGSMQALSETLERALAAAGGRFLVQHRVEGLRLCGHGWRIRGRRRNADRPSAAGPAGLPADGAPPDAAESFAMEARDVVLTLPPQTLPGLLGEQLPGGYRRRLERLNEPSGALVFYGAVARQVLPQDCPSHLQKAGTAPGPLFVSVSQEGDGRAPAGRATVIASVFTAARPWHQLERADYRRRKDEAMAQIRSDLEELLGIAAGDWLHGELATPRGFARWTGRPWGYVGGLGQHPDRFGPFGLASRTPLSGLWLCGDSIHPGEGTAGVSLSALTVCRQVLATRGIDLILEAAAGGPGGDDSRVGQP